MTEAAKEARRAYYRDYYQRTKERQKQLKDEYWARKAARDGFNATKSAESATKGGDPGC